MNQFKEFGFPETRPPNRKRHAHLDTMQAVRNEDPWRRLDWAAPMFSIPPLDWAVLKVRFPDLISPDHEIKKRAWNKFARDPASEPYRAKDRVWRPITGS